MTAALPDYYVEELSIVMEFEIVLQNPCNSGNSIIINDPDDSGRTEIGTLTIMSEWSNEVIDLNNIFID